MNPENDNLDALGSYLCQMTNHLCAHAHISCRLHIADLPANIQVSSQLRHNITMVVKEAVHNAVKHARASELSLTMAFEHGALEISIEDNGGGFPAAAGPSGNGLTNMERRMAEINGKCLLESRVGSGTTVQLRVVFPGKPMNEGPNGHQMRQTQYEKNSNGG
jgi:signal transduction histidine kinase